MRRDISIPGYWLVTRDGAVFAFGAADLSSGHPPEHRPGKTVGIAALANGAGYWVATTSGEVRSFGEARPLPPETRSARSRAVVGILAAPDSDGFWLPARDGSIGAFGSAHAFPPISPSALSAPVVGMAATPDGDGGWLACADGSVHALGDAAFWGPGDLSAISTPIVGIAASDGDGYWLVARNGAVFTFGSASFFGAVHRIGVTATVVAIAAAPDSGGYLLVGPEGNVYPFGVAAFHGPWRPPVLTQPVVGLACLGRQNAAGQSKPEQELLLALAARQSAFHDPAGAAGVDELPPEGLSLPLASSPQVSIIVPVHGRADLTARCLCAITASTPDVRYEVIVVDDLSPDGTIDLLARVENVKVVRNAENLGFVASCNRGAAEARGRYLAFLNNDTEVADGWLSSLVASAEDAPTIGIVGAKLLYPGGGLQEAGGIVFRSGEAMNYGRGCDPIHPEFNFVRDVDYCSGACLLVRRDFFEQVGGFDERYAPAYYEDVDIAFTARAHGYRVVYQPKAEVVHLEGATSGVDHTQGVKHYQVVNREKFVDKWQNELRSQLHSSPENVVIARSRRRSRRALFVDAEVPQPDRDAGSLRAWHLVNLLSELGFDVTFMGLDRYPDQPYAERLRQKGIEVVTTHMDFDRCLAALGPWVDLCILARPEVGWQHLRAVREHAPGAVVVYDSVDLAFVRESRRGQLERDEGVSASASALRELELALARACDAVIVTTPDEQQVLESLVPGVTTFVLPTIHVPQSDPPPLDGRAGLLFVGGFRHPPNIDAIEYLVEDILPRIRQQAPELLLTIAGSEATRAVHALASESVDVVGWVADLAPLYARAQAFVAPLRYGAGMKGKIGESLAHGLPIVTTPVGSEGLGAEPGRHLLLADDASSFASEVVRLCRDAALWKRLQREGVGLVTERFSPEAVRESLSKMVAHLGVPARSRPAARAYPADQSAASDER